MEAPGRVRVERIVLCSHERGSLHGCQMLLLGWFSSICFSRNVTNTIFGSETYTQLPVLKLFKTSIGYGAVYLYRTVVLWYFKKQRRFWIKNFSHSKRNHGFDMHIL